MRGRTILLLPITLALALASCNTRQRIGGAAVGVTVVGLGLTYSNDSRSDEEVGTQGKVGITMILVGLVTLFVVAAIDESANEPPPKEIKIATRGTTAVQRAEEQAALTNQQRRAQAWDLTKQAQAAARENDCAKVTELSAQVGALDAEFYADLFLKDVAIQRCLQPAPPPPSTTRPPALPPPTITPTP